MSRRRSVLNLDTVLDLIRAVFVLIIAAAVIALSYIGTVAMFEHNYAKAAAYGVIILMLNEIQKEHQR